jgi:DNA modification methylase
MTAYLDFLRQKIRLADFAGFEVSDSDINPILKPHQRAIVRWAVRGGCRAIFAAFGLGKSVIQIEILRLIQLHAGGQVLICVPLGVRQEFRRDGKMLGVDFKFIRTPDEMEGGHLFYLTNYESVRDGKLDPNLFTAVSLDEASVLRSFGSKTYQTFLSLFSSVRYRFVATATPSPNRYKELIHYAGFLGIMDTGQALTRFFQRDSTKANNLTLYPHKEAEFWLWLNSWAIFLQKPSDLGFSDEGYALPELKVIVHEVPANHEAAGTEKDGQGMLFKNVSLGVQQASAEKRDSLDARVAQMMQIINGDPGSHYLLWHDLEDERHAIQKALPEAVSVYGSQDLDEREQRIVEFSDGKFKYLSAKPVIAGSGCNFQRHCHKAIFVGIGFKFNDFIQAVHRIQRFLQAQPVEIHIIHSEAEREVMRTLMDKWQAHETMVQKMTEIIRKHGLNTLSMQDILARTIGVERLEVSGDNFRVANNDCVLEAESMATDSVDLIVTSIPFANHYEYTPSYNDFGHTENNDHFWAQMDFLTPQLLRILKPGRMYCCHVKDRILFGNVTGAGAPTVSPFHAEALFHAKKHGFDYMGMITVVTDVVRENNQTYRLGWSEQCKDGTKMGVGSPEYVLLLRKPQTDRTRGYADEPVTKSKEDYTRAQWQVDAHAFWRSSGNRQLTADELATLGPDKLAKAFTEYSLQNVYDYEFHVKIGQELEARGALPSTFMSLAPGSHDDTTWHDVNRMITLNGNQTQKGLQNHVCPLQFDIVDRLINRYSNPGDVVHDPFGGLMTVPYRAQTGPQRQRQRTQHRLFLRRGAIPQSRRERDGHAGSVCGAGRRRRRITEVTHMTTQLTAQHIAGRNGQPLAVVNGLPGLDAQMTPTQLRQLARQANQIAIDSESGVRGMRRYPETEEQSNE